VRTYTPLSQLVPLRVTQGSVSGSAHAHEGRLSKTNPVPRTNPPCGFGPTKISHLKSPVYPLCHFQQIQGMHRVLACVPFLLFLLPALPVPRRRARPIKNRLVPAGGEPQCFIHGPSDARRKEASYATPSFFPARGYQQDPNNVAHGFGLNSRWRC